MHSINVIRKVTFYIVSYLEIANTRRKRREELSMYTVVLHRRFDHRNFGVFIGQDVPEGFYIVTVEPNSPAADANIQPGDQIVAVNGQLVNSADTIAQISSQADSLTLSLRSSDILALAGIFLNNSNQVYTPKYDNDLEK